MKPNIPLLWRSKDGLYRVQINRRCIPRMQRIATQHRPNEVGTPLAGHYEENGHLAVITALGPLPPDSKGGRTWFIRGVEGLQEHFQRLHRRFRGRRYRVGEWHSHPDAHPTASSVDDMNQSELAEDVAEGLEEAILVILGGNLSDKSLLGVYVYSSKRGRVVLAPA